MHQTEETGMTGPRCGNKQWENTEKKQSSYMKHGGKIQKKKDGRMLLP